MVKVRHSKIGIVSDCFALKAKREIGIGIASKTSPGGRTRNSVSLIFRENAFRSGKEMAKSSMEKLDPENGVDNENEEAQYQDILKIRYRRD